jgi:hypothetical protein
LHTLVGIRPEVAAFVQHLGADYLIALLERNGYFPVVAPERSSIVNPPSPSAP